MTGISNEDIIGTQQCMLSVWRRSQRGPGSDCLDGESQGRRMPRSRAAGWTPGGGAKRRFKAVAREDAKSVGVREANAEDQDGDGG